jgi:hypothetical protein
MNNDDIHYTLNVELKTPWIGKPYLEHHIVKHYFAFDMDCFYEDRKYWKVIFNLRRFTEKKILYLEKVPRLLSIFS